MKFADGSGLAQPVVWLCARGSIAALALLSWMPGQHMVRTGLLSGTEEHFLAYMISAMVIVATRPRLGPVLAAVFYVLLAGVFENGQNFAPGRSPAAADFIASSAGAIIGIATLMLMRRSMPSAPLTRRARSLLSHPHVRGLP